MSGVSCVILWYGSVLVINKELSPGGLVSFLTYTLTIGLSFSGITNLYGDLMKAVGEYIDRAIHWWMCYWYVLLLDERNFEKVWISMVQHFFCFIEHWRIMCVVCVLCMLYCCWIIIFRFYGTCVFSFGSCISSTYKRRVAITSNQGWTEIKASHISISVETWYNCVAK